MVRLTKAVEVTKVGTTDANDANICIVIVGGFLMLTNSLPSFSIWKMHCNLI